MDQGQWLTVEQVAERLQFHPDTVRRLLREGKLQGYRQTRRGGWRIRATEIDRFITEGPLIGDRAANEAAGNE